jgi:hypothetical protein
MRVFFEVDLVLGPGKGLPPSVAKSQMYGGPVHKLKVFLVVSAGDSLAIRPQRGIKRSRDMPEFWCICVASGCAEMRWTSSFPMFKEISGFLLEARLAGPVPRPPALDQDYPLNDAKRTKL